MAVLLCVFASAAFAHDADALRTVLARDAGWLAAKEGAVPGCLVVDGERAVPLAFGRVGGSRAVVAAAGTFEKGRAVGVTHHGFFEGKAGKRGENVAFLRECLAWLAGGKMPKTVRLDVRLGSMREMLEFVLKERGSDCGVEMLRGYDELATLPAGAVVVTMPDSHPLSDAARLKAFLRRGGGVLAPVVGWGWLQLHAGKSFGSDSPFNAALGAAGIYSCGAIANSVRDGLYEFAAQKDLPGTTVKSALELVEGGLSKELGRSCLFTLERIDEVMPPDDGLWRPRLKALAKSAAEIVPSAAHPLRIDNLRERIAYIVFQNDWQSHPDREWPAAAAAAVYPGVPAKGTPRVTRDVVVDLSIPRRHGTGLFAAAGEPLTVTLPEGAEKLGLRLRVGATHCRLTACEEWRRAPVVDVELPLAKPSVTFSSPFGGTVYVVVPRATSGKVSVKIGPACPAPWFVEGRDTPETWAAQLRESLAPWAEIESDRIAITVPVSRVRDLADPRPLLNVWRDIMDNDAYLISIPKERKSPERICTDVQLCCGYMHSGYPIMMPDGSAGRLVSEPTIRAGREDDVWGFFHEMGHNHQNYDWTFDGTGEVTVNFFSLYNMEKICGRGLWDMKLTGEGHRRRVKEWNEKGRPLAMWKNDPFLALDFFARLIDQYGWEVFRKFFAEYNSLPAEERPKTDLEKRQQWCSRLSRIVGKDLSSEFGFLL